MAKSENKPSRDIVLRPGMMLGTPPPGTKIYAYDCPFCRQRTLRTEPIDHCFICKVPRFGKEDGNE